MRYNVFEEATLYFSENGRYDAIHVLYALNHAKHVSVIARYFFLEIDEIPSAQTKIQHAILTRTLPSI